MSGSMKTVFKNWNHALSGRYIGLFLSKGEDLKNEVKVSQHGEVYEGDTAAKNFKETRKREQSRQSAQLTLALCR